MVFPESPSAPVSDLPIALRKGTRQCTTRHPISHVLNYTALSVSDRSFLARLDAITVPRTLSEALSHPGWRQAMQEELAALEQNQTWELCSLPRPPLAAGGSTQLKCAPMARLIVSRPDLLQKGILRFRGRIMVTPSLQWPK